MRTPADLDRSSQALLVDRLTKVYGDGTTALDELELRIPAGCFFGLLGPNGAGKTTLIGIASGLVRAAAGRVFVFGHDIADDLQARLLVGVAPQEVHLDRFLTAHEVLSYHGRYFGLGKLEANTRADELLDVFDLSAKTSTKPNPLGRDAPAAADRPRAGAPPTARDPR
jgi:ABC-2 type transport system ATP-binding protein